jgi:hypothetical protein
MVDVRAGRSVDRRTRFARRLTEACEIHLAVPAAMFTVLLTHQTGDEAYRNGRLAPHLSPDEGQTRHAGSTSSE